MECCAGVSKDGGGVRSERKSASLSVSTIDGAVASAAPSRLSDSRDRASYDQVEKRSVDKSRIPCTRADASRVFELPDRRPVSASVRFHSGSPDGDDGVA